MTPRRSVCCSSFPLQAAIKNNKLPNVKNNTITHSAALVLSRGAMIYLLTPIFIFEYIYSMYSLIFEAARLVLSTPHLWQLSDVG